MSTYQWRRCDSSGASCVDIGGATSSTYVPVLADVGSTIRVVKTVGIDSATSPPTDVIQPAGSPPLGTMLFRGDFNQFSAGTTSGVTPTWDHYSDPNPGSAHPPTIISDPTGTYGGTIMAMTVDPTDGYVTGSGTQSSRVDIYQNARTAYAREGLEVWWLYQLFFPSQGGGKTGGKPYYRPVNGDWNWLCQWHHASSIVGSTNVEFSLGMTTDSTTSSANPRFKVNCRGGLNTAITVKTWDQKSAGTVIGGSNRLIYDHWYTVLGHTLWTKGAGYQRLWIDGTACYDFAMPTLLHTASQDDVPNFECSNYRWMGQSGGVNWSSSYFIRKARVGTTQAIVES